MDTNDQKIDQKPAAGGVVSAEVKAELRRKRERAALLSQELPDGIEDRLKSGRRNLKVKGKHQKKKLADECDAAERGETVEPEVMDVAPVDPAVVELAKRTPEVRFTKAHMMRPFTDDELKIIAAALRSRMALFRVADTLKCSYQKIKNAIESIPVLKELAEARSFREKEEIEEAVDACVLARVPAVVMWKAEKILPEKYGNQVNLDNEDDTKLVIGALSPEDIAEAEAKVAECASRDPINEDNAVLELMEKERAAEMAAAGAGVPVSPLNQVPPAPAVNPPAGDPNFGPFTPAAGMGRADFEVGFDDGFGGGGGFDDGFGGDGGPF